MPTNFTVVPVEARADGGGDEAAERTEAPGTPEGPEPERPSPGERGRTWPDKGRAPRARVWALHPGGEVGGAVGAVAAAVGPGYRRRPFPRPHRLIFSAPHEGPHPTLVAGLAG